MGPGCAFIDYDNDGCPDILLVNGEDWPGHARRAIHAEALPQQSRRHIHRRDSQSWPRRFHVRNGRRRRRLRQRRLRRYLHHRARPEPSLPQQRQRHFHRCDQVRGPLGPERVLHQRRLGRLRSRRQARSRRRQLCAVDSQKRDLYCTLDGSHKSYCTPESYKGTSARLWHNLGNGKFEDATQKAGLLRSHLQESRRCHPRLQQ